MKRARLASGIALTLLLAPACICAAPHTGKDPTPPTGATSPAPAEAEANKAAAENKLRALRQQLQTLAAQQRELAGERSDASKALRAADAGVGQAARSLRETNAAIAAQQARLTDLESRQKTLEQQLSAQRAALAALLRSAYALGDSQQLKLLLSQDRVADLARVMAYHHYFEQDRMRRIGALTEQLKSLADLSRQVDAQREALAASRHDQVARLADVQAQRAQRGKLVADLDARYHDSAAHLRELGRDSGALEALIRKLSTAMTHAPPVHAPVESARHGAPAPPVPIPFHGPGGHFPWPLEGEVVGGYGGGSNGLLIAAAAGAEVHAIADGRVAFADWLKGYGLLVIVDHGDGLMSLYANNDALLKNAGDAVHAGETISTVGSSGGQGRNALYFEIRQDGKPVDPRAWLRKR